MLHPTTQGEQLIWDKAEQLLRRYKAEGSLDTFATIEEVQLDHADPTQAVTALVYLSDDTTFEFNIWKEIA
jgi:hypothetical protein